MTFAVFPIFQESMTTNRDKASIVMMRAVDCPSFKSKKINFKRIHIRTKKIITRMKKIIALWVLLGIFPFACCPDSDLDFIAVNGFTCMTLFNESVYSEQSI
ncbi:MAG: hypothetical protein ACI8XB_002161 [Patiriisocius sp.]